MHPGQCIRPAGSARLEVEHAASSIVSNWIGAIQQVDHRTHRSHERECNQARGRNCCGSKHYHAGVVHSDVLHTGLKDTICGPKSELRATGNQPPPRQVPSAPASVIQQAAFNAASFDSQQVHDTEKHRRCDEASVEQSMVISCRHPAACDARHNAAANQGRVHPGRILSGVAEVERYCQRTRDAIGSRLKRGKAEGGDAERWSWYCYLSTKS